MRHSQGVRVVAFGPDGRTVLTGSFDGTARVWDATTGKPLGEPMVHQGLVRRVGYASGGKTVVTASFDHTARLWKTPEPGK
jgi:WD40 repeat protein